MANFSRLKLALIGATALAGCSTMATAPAGVSAEAWAIHNRLMTLDTHLDTPAFSHSGTSFVAPCFCCCFLLLSFRR